MLKAIVHNHMFAIVVVIATILLFGGLDLTVIQTVHAAPGHGTTGGAALPPAAPTAVSERNQMVFWVSGVLCCRLAFIEIKKRYKRNNRCQIYHNYPSSILCLFKQVAKI
ncbi:MAG: hypothetical protein WBF33_33290 [Candidatus Nitrosopolaris sp.]|jgi:hypothetical protein